MSGFILLHRTLQRHWLWERKPFSQGQAWVDLLLLAAFCDHDVRPGRQVQRGQLWTTLRYLGQRWGWGKDRVARFIRRLESERMVSAKRDRRRDTGGTVISILKYDQYQSIDRDTEDDKSATQTRHKRDYHKERNKGTRKTNRRVAPDADLDLPKCLKPCESAIRDWLRYKDERGQGYRPTGLRALIKRLEGFGGADQVAAAIQTSMSNGWQGLFEPKNGSQPDQGERVLKPNEMAATLPEGPLPPEVKDAYSKEGGV